MMGQSVKIIYLHAVFCVGVFGEGEQVRWEEVFCVYGDKEEAAFEGGEQGRQSHLGKGNDGRQGLVSSLVQCRGYVTRGLGASFHREVERSAFNGGCEWNCYQGKWGNHEVWVLTVAEAYCGPQAAAVSTYGHAAPFRGTHLVTHFILLYC